jgi:hypothetical protein
MKIKRLAITDFLLSAFCLTNGTTISEAQSLRKPVAKYLKLQTPVTGNWYVLAGPPCPSKTNHHCKINSQKFAYDFIKLDQRGQPTSCLGTTVTSPTNGTIVTVVDQNPNRVKGKRPTGHPAGNHIVIHRRGNEFVILAHLSPHTIQVAVAPSPYGFSGPPSNAVTPEKLPPSNVRLSAPPPRLMAPVTLAVASMRVSELSSLLVMAMPDDPEVTVAVLTQITNPVEGKICDMVQPFCRLALWIT